MRSGIKLLILLYVIVLYASCEDDFEVNAEWKDITIVYCLLDPNDTIHFIKINKAYLNEETSAIEIAKNVDSTHYADTILDVRLEQWKNGKHINVADDILFDREFYPGSKDTGIFSEDQYLYRSRGDRTLLNTDPKVIYKLKITNKQSGKIISSSANVVGDLSPSRPSENSALAFNPSGQTEISWYVGSNAYFYDLDIFITYLEREKGTSTWKDTFSLRWPVFSYRRTTGLDAGEFMKTKIPGQNLYVYLSNHIQEDTRLERKLDHFEFVYYAGGKEIYYYIHVNQPSIGIIQKKPEYSNIENGYGIFSSRNIYRFNARLQNVDTLIYNPYTIDLNFIN